ncbi:MAG: hypothetical protein QM733_03000 [Ilumatobacteraceae bacterium]
MPGVVIVLLVLVVFPIVTCLGSAAIAAALGWLLNKDGEDRNEGSELLELNL